MTEILKIKNFVQRLESEIKEQIPHNELKQLSQEAFGKYDECPVPENRFSHKFL